MDDKKFSLFVLVFVFVVAVPSMVFLFSGNGGSTGEASQELVLGPGGIAYPYQKTYQYGPQTGVEIPIYDDKGNFVRYEKRVHTKTGQAIFRPYYEQTYSGEKSGCPEGYYRISYNEAAAYNSMGKKVEKFGDEYCWFPAEY